MKDRRSRIGSRLGELTLGHTVNAAMVYGFDYALYPFVIWKLGLVKGGVTMSVLSLIACQCEQIIHDADDAPMAARNGLTVFTSSAVMSSPPASMQSFPVSVRYEALLFVTREAAWCWNATAGKAANSERSRNEGERGAVVLFHSNFRTSNPCNASRCLSSSSS